MNLNRLKMVSPLVRQRHYKILVQHLETKTPLHKSVDHAKILTLYISFQRIPSSFLPRFERIATIKETQSKNHQTALIREYHLVSCLRRCRINRSLRLSSSSTASHTPI